MSHKFVKVIPVLEDRYSYVAVDQGSTYLIDAGNYEDIYEFLKENDINLDYILCTHYHSDHLDGIFELKKKFDCKVYGPKDFKIKVVDIFLDMDKKTLFNESVEAIPTPGHTKSHLIYYFPNEKILFSGDLLFGAGCGKVFEGTHLEMLNSLKKIKDLPSDSHIYFGHEYTVKNLEFAYYIEPNNEDIRSRLNKAKDRIKKNEFTVPSTLEDELKTNPFLRADCDALKKSIDMSEATELEIFTYLRNLKDNF